MYISYGFCLIRIKVVNNRNVGTVGRRNYILILLNELYLSKNVLVQNDCGKCMFVETSVCMNVLMT